MGTRLSSTKTKDDKSVDQKTGFVKSAVENCNKPINILEKKKNC
jgi:hypothetical protein